MEIIGPSSEDDMVAAFLQAEIHSSRWGPNVREHMSQAGVTEAMVETPNLADAFENERRAAVLTSFRGWRTGTFLFSGWPDGISWHRANLTPSDVPHIRYANAPEWKSLSRGTWMATVGAERIASNDVHIEAGVPVAAINGIREAIAAGKTFPPIIAVGPPSGRVVIVVEGHSRITAYLTSGFPERLEIIYGAAPLNRLAGWSYFPAAPA
jgi:hypothetical protein